MSANSDDIRVRIAGDLADINRALQDLRKQTRDAGREASSSARSWNALGSGLDGLKRQVAGLVTAYASFRGVQSLFRAVIANTREAEEVAAQLEARVKSTGGAAGLTTEQLLAMASDFQRVTAFGDEAVASMEAVLLTFTEVRGDAFIAATEAALNMATALKTDLQSAALQVGKALNDPVRGVTALQRAGVQLTAQQRELVKQFVETGDVAGAQRVILEELETQFGGAARAARDTLGGSLEALKNAASDLLEGDGGTIGDLRVEIERLIEVLQDPATREGMQLLIAGGTRAAGVGVGFLSEFGDLGKRIAEVAAQIGGVATEADRLEAELKNVDEALRLGTFSFSRAIPLLGKSREELLAMREELERALEAARAVEAPGVVAPSAAPTETPAAAAVAPIDARPAIQALQAQLAAAGALVQDELKRVRETLDRDFERNLVRFADYYRRRVELETQAIDQQLEAQRAALALIDEEIRLAQARGDEIAEQEAKRAKLVADITVLERQRADVATKAARDQADAERALATELEQVRIRLAQLQGDEIGARGGQLEAEFRDLLARLQVEGDAEGEALVRRLIDVELARTRLQELEGEYDRTLSQLARAERRVELQVETGLISEREGRRRIVELHQQTAEEVEQLIPLMRELALATGDPEAIERLEDLQLELEELRATTETLGKEMREDLQDAGTDAFASFLSGAETAKGAFQSFIDDMRQRLAEFVADQLFQKLFQVLGGIGTGGGGGGGGVGEFFAGLLHEGGDPAQPKRRRMVPAITFASAPRLHSGLPGLASDEFPAILQAGEEVLSRGDPRNSRNGGVAVNVFAQDFQSFQRASPSQIGAAAASALLRARNRNGG